MSSTKRRHARNRRLGVAGTGAFLSVFAVVMLFYWNAYATWSTAPGQITASTADSDSSGWSVHIRYRYLVDGQRYEAERVSWFGTPVDLPENEARELMARYPEGRNVMVRYDPDDPASAMLEFDDHGWVFLAGFLVVALVVFVVGVVLVVRFRRSTRRSSASG